MKKLKYLSWFIPFVFFACETTIEVELPQEPSRLVVNCILNQDSIITASVTRSEMVDERVTDWAISGATVELFKNGSLLETLDESSLNSGQYISTVIPENTANYSIKVSKEGYDQVEGSTYFAEPIEIEKVEYTKTKVAYDSLLRFDLTFTDPVNTTDFYTIEVYERFAYYDSWLGDTVYTYSRLYLYDTYDVVFETNYPNGELGTFFEDELFNGKTYTVGFAVYWDQFFNETDVQYELVLGRTDEAHYNYNRSFTYYLSSYYDPFSEPVQVYSNIENGYGVLGSKSIDSEIVVVKK